MVTLIILVGFSRNYLGVHTPQDVLVSLFIGVALFKAVDMLERYFNEAPSGDLLVLMGGIAVSTFLVCYARFKTYPVDLENGELVKMMAGTFKASGGVAGISLGCFIEKRWIGFEAEQGTWENKLFRFLMGSSILCVLFKTLPGFAARNFGSLKGPFVYGFSIPLFITVLFPAFIKLAYSKYRQAAGWGAAVACVLYLGVIL